MFSSYFSSFFADCVILGYSRDGNFLVSYSTNPVITGSDGEHLKCNLQLWTAPSDGILRCIWNRRLFDTQQFQRSLETCLEFVDADEDDDPLLRILRLTVTETSDGQLLVVHGWFQSSTPLEPTHHFITALPGPALRPCTFSIAHISFLSSSPSDPAIDWAVTVYELQVDDPVPGLEVALGLWLGSSQQAFLRVRLLQEPLLKERDDQGCWNGTWQTHTLESYTTHQLTSLIPEPVPESIHSLGWRACWKSMPFHASAFNGEGPIHIVFTHHSVYEDCKSTGGSICEQQSDESTSRVAIGLCLPKRVADAEQAIEAFMSGCGIAPSAFRDYLAVPLLERRPCRSDRQNQTDLDSSPVCCLSWSPILQTHGMLMLVLLLLDTDHHTAVNTPPPASDIALVVHLPVDCKADFAHVLAALPLKHPWKRGGGEGLMDEAAFLVGRALESSSAVPAPFPWHLPLTLSNRSVIEKGESLSVLVHPWLPHVLCGFNGGG